MLTGDKLETAKCIAISTGFKNTHQSFIEISSDKYSTIKKILNRKDPVNDLMVVTGDSLEIIMQSDNLRKIFFK